MISFYLSLLVFLHFLPIFRFVFLQLSDHLPMFVHLLQKFCLPSFCTYRSSVSHLFVLTRIPSFSLYFLPCLPSAAGPFSSVCPPPPEVRSPVCLYLLVFLHFLPIFRLVFPSCRTVFLCLSTSSRSSVSRLFVLTEVLSPVCLYLQKFCLPSVCTYRSSVSRLFVLTRIPSFSPYFPPCLPSAVGLSSAVCPPPPEVLSPVCPAGLVCPARCPSSLSYLGKEICNVFGIPST